MRFNISGKPAYSSLKCASEVGGLSQAVDDAIIRRSIDAGINFIDKAHVYGVMGQSEEIIGP
jgi:aryl-alcohol dehydrogenase-like predicted oxidoreductase